MGASVRLAGAHHARRAGRLAAVDPLPARARPARSSGRSACAGAGRLSARAPAGASRVGRFVLRCLGWLPVTFAVWYFAAPVLLAPSIWLVRAFCAAAFPELVRHVEQSAATVTFVTSVGAGAVARGVVTVDVNGLLYSFGLPLFAALTLATQGMRARWPLLIGYAALLPFVAWGLVADFLKNVAITAGPGIASQAGFSAWQREAIALAYQLGSLILPAVVPVVLWVALQVKAGSASIVAALRTSTERP